MKKCIFLFFTLLAITAAGQEKLRNVRQEIALLRTKLTENHVQPKVIDDKFSGDLFDKLLDDLDPDRLFFTRSDVTSLQPFRDLIDDEISGKDTGFLNRLKEQFKKGLHRSEKLINHIMESPIDWQKNETFLSDAERVEDELKLADRHRQWLKHQILGRLSDMLQRDSVTTGDFFKRNVSEASAYVKVATLRPIARLLKDPVLYDDEMADIFLAGIASVFDPHSAFFSTRDYDDFVASLSTEDYYFGFTLGEDGRGNVVISALAPGGAAWKSGALHVSDVLLAVKWSDEERINVRGMNLDDVNDILDSNEGSVIEMTLRAVDGKEKRVMLRKEKLESEGTVVQSFILQGGIKTGYIYLPDFYTRWDDEQEGGRCANDVAKEIIKLKKEGVEGLILDLRFNGGGSLYEARAMAGIFIDEGPLAMVRGSDSKTVSLKDLNRGTVYDGPLVIMVNGGSASASEVLAASIQDYNRGLIVGSQTYGKATSQNILPLGGLPSSASSRKNGEGNMGYVKVTTQRLYRLTGKSAQGRGVTPDVVIPDIFRVLDVSEREYPFMLQPDSIPTNIYYKPLLPAKRKELRARSQERLSKNSAFQELQKTITWLEGEMKKSAPEPLLWENYLAATAEASKHQINADLYFESQEKIYEVSNGPGKDERLAVDDYARQINERWMQILTGDLYLKETYQILRDHILLTKNP